MPHIGLWAFHQHVKYKFNIKKSSVGINFGHVHCLLMYITYISGHGAFHQHVKYEYNYKKTFWHKLRTRTLSIAVQNVQMTCHGDTFRCQILLI